MKVTADRIQFSQAFAAVAPIVNARSPHESLGHVKFEATQQGGEFIAQGGDIAIRRSVGGLTIAEPGECFLMPDRVTAILRASTDKQLEIEADAAKIRIIGTRSKYEMPTVDSSGFPAVPRFTTSNYVAVWGDDLHRMIRRTTFAAERLRQNIVMNGVLWEVDTTAEPAQMRMVAIGSTAMAKDFAEVETEGTVPSLTNASPTVPVLPVTALQQIRRLIPDDGTVDVWLDFARSDRIVGIRTDHVTIWTAVVAGRFPDYERLLKDDLTADADVVAFRAGELRSAIEQAAVSSDQESAGIDFKFQPGSAMLKGVDGNLALSGRSERAGDAHVDFPITYAGSPFQTSLDPNKGFLDGLRAVGDDADVEVRLRNPALPVVVRHADGFVFMVMPMRK